MFKYYNGEEFELEQDNEHGYVFVKILYHNVASGYFNTSNVEHIGSCRDGLYSRLDYLDILKTTNDDKYIFKLKYPKFSDKIEIWKQTNKPQNDTNYSSNSLGYEPIVHNSNVFGGLSLSSSSGSAYLDGDKFNGGWWFAVGSYAVYYEGMPGPIVSDSSTCDSVELWLATDLDKFRDDEEWEINTEKTFSYTGSTQTIVLTPGKYKFECYGARGGNGYGNSRGGYGGYVAGYIFIDPVSNVYLNIGQAGNDNNSRRASFNGGAIGGTDNLGGAENGGSGGGATDIRIQQNTLAARVIVAGGGGGAGGWSSSAGQPGGLGTSESNVRNGLGTGTNGTLGTGTNGITANSGGGGGGGGYYGGTTRGTQVVQYTVGCGAYGGSNYINESLEYIDTQAGVCSGNGYIKITYIYRGYAIKHTNCDIVPSSYKQIDEVQYAIITIPENIKKNFVIYGFNRFIVSPKMIIDNIDKTHYRLTIPANANYTISIDAIFDLAMRTNSDIYKNVHENVIDMEILDALKGE